MLFFLSLLISLLYSAMTLDQFIGTASAFVISTKGKPLLKLDRYEYRFGRERVTDSTTIYRCVLKTCTATAEVSGGTIQALNGIHSCNPTSTKASKREISNKILELAPSSSRGQTRTVVANALTVSLTIE